MRVLILADDCNPDWPSLPVVGYKYARAIADHADVTVATQIRNRSNIDRAGFGKAKVVYLDTEKIAAPLYKLAGILRGGSNKAWTTQIAMNYPSYLAFEWVAWQNFGRDLKAGCFDIVHRITPMTPTLPSLMASLSPVPFVLGPLNGNLPWPKQFKQEQVRERELLSQLRSAYKLLPFYRSTYRRSACILAAFKHTAADLPPSAIAKMIDFPEIGIDPELFQPTERMPKQRMTVLFAGRLVPYKLPEVVVKAFAASPLLQQHQLIIVGEGPERPRLEALIQDNHLEGCVQLLGQKSQAEVGELMRKSEIFAFPSIRELGAGVVIEAMACGMACVVVDYGAPGELIENDRGLKVPLDTLELMVTKFTQKLEHLVQNPEQVEQLGSRAYEYAMKYFPWDVKAEKTVNLYDWIKTKQGSKPDLWQKQI
jgi:glycosyltransferase involved in cell wall biosynthesis